MAHYGYSIKDVNESRAHAVIRDAPISYKVAVMLGKRIKGMPAQKAIRYLQAVQRTEQAVPFTTFNDGFGHKKGIGPGKYPIKASKLFEGLVANAVANAEDRGLGKDVAIEFVVAQQASRSWHAGRQGRRKFKRSHVELVVTNAPIVAEKTTKPASAAKPAPKAAKKTAPTPEASH